ncbi:hypothetical protein [Chryseobacterium shandongense]|uniref:hypothetical protein n=1 Tax=Chryseobacterium shandongense TaxID=1493872 RepID=UPI000F5016A9|nr:hypothetical protein [Chryseobacterium shandongense]AZA56943.1 hypothetical protein EG350_07025 [Chryseobacterium shandongense]
MSLIDDSNFPMVFVNVEHDESVEHDHDDDLKDFERLLERQQKFILINEGAAPNTDYKHSKEETRRVNHFLKTNRVRLKEYAIATIQVEPSSLKRLAFKPFQNIFVKYWGMKLLLATSREEAIAMANAELQLEEQRVKS